MAETLPLFPEEPSNSFQEELRAVASRLSERQVYFGTSSWKYEGWLGQIYSQQRYMFRGRFSKARFAEQCLSEYAETFPTVCGDFAFYQFPVQSFWRKLFDSSPAQLRFSFKVPEEITTPSYPSIERYGNLGGSQNPNFLNAEVLQALPKAARSVFLSSRRAGLRIRRNVWSFVQSVRVHGTSRPVPGRSASAISIRGRDQES